MKIGVDLLTIGNNYSGNKLTTPKTEKPHTKEMNTKDKKITQVTLETEDNLKQACICLQQWIQVIQLHPAKKLFHSKIWLTIEKNQSLSTNTYERKDHRRDHKSSRNKNTTENIPVNRTERCNERRYFHGRNNVCNIYGTTYIGRKCLASFFRRRQTQPRRTLPVLQTLSSTKTVNP